MQLFEVILHKIGYTCASSRKFIVYAKNLKCAIRLATAKLRDFSYKDEKYVPEVKKVSVVNTSFAYLVDF
jgi:hypothetical protein